MYEERSKGPGGMSINWDKSQLMWLGGYSLPGRTPVVNSPPLLRVLHLGRRIRLLGIDIGHEQHDKRQAWRLLREQLTRAVDNHIHRLSDQLADTLTANACLGGAATYILSFMPISQTDAADADKLILSFIRGHVYTIRSSNRSASRKHGNVVPFQPTGPRAVVQQARFAARILTGTPRQGKPPYASMWLAEMNALARHAKFACLDHLIMSGHQKEYSARGVAFQRFTNLSVNAFIKLGYTRPITNAWEDVADIPIFSNAQFTRDNGEPWLRTTAGRRNAFHGAPSLKYLHQLLSPRHFTIEDYRTSSIVAPCRLATAQEIQRRYFRDWGTPLQEIVNLLNRLKNHYGEWYRILIGGNTERSDGEFFATRNPANHRLTKVYEYRAGHLRVYDGALRDYSAILQQTDERGRPGVDGFPEWDQLYRVRLAVISDRQVRVFSCMLPEYTDSRWHPYDGGVLMYQYSNAHKPSFKENANVWRNSLTPRPPEITEFCQLAFGDSTFDLTKLTGVTTAISGQQTSRNAVEDNARRPIHRGQWPQVPSPCSGLDRRTPLDVPRVLPV